MEVPEAPAFPGRGHWASHPGSGAEEGEELYLASGQGRAGLPPA